MPRVLALLLAALVSFHAGCGTVSDNNRRGLMMLGGASVFIGGVISADTLSCDDSATNAQDCDEDRDDLIAGLSLLVAGAAILGVAIYLKARSAAPPPAAASGN